MTLITLAHGSRHPDAARTVEELTAAAGALLGVPARAAYLDLAEPDLPAAAQQAPRAVVVPLLFTRAYHARHDVPAAARAARESGARLAVAEPLGLGPDVEEVVVRAVGADAEPGAHLVFYSVGSSRPGANAEVAALCARVARRAGRGHSVVFATGKGRGVGVAGLDEAARRHRRLHLVPLFVAPGLLLDRALDALPTIAARRGAVVGASAPLGERLAPLVTARYRAAQEAGVRERRAA
ncbi:CbiX/SirB N-terminal domain-containing protein [Corynebacterium mastitidis]|uniref:CbiX/SirB N-terminal domain-containing protein n=1 Tax=Corynebacterium mastitidis TaxID=161890 RepID=A0ABU8NUY7_9CORY